MACVVLFLVFILSVGRVQAREPLVPATKPLEIQMPSFDEKTLSCGIKVLFFKNDDLPLVSAELLIPGGYGRDPEGKEGLASLMDATLRNGGAGKLSPEGFDAALENRAASMDASADNESFTASFKCLSKDLPDILDLFADMVMRPEFDEKRFETSKDESLDELNRLEDTPDSLTRVIFNRALMAHSQYGRWATPKTVSSLTVADVKAFYEKNYGPQKTVMVITGNFDEDKVSSQLEKLFGDWKNPVAPAASKDAEPLGPTIYFFPKDVTQVFVRWGVLGIQRHDPNQVPLDVANYILGGSGFTSRLMREIRSNRGLAYFVDSVSVPYDVRGIFEVIGGTRPDSLKEYLDTMFKVMGDYAHEGPTDKELAEAKQSMVEEFAYNFESPYTLAPYKASLDFHGYPADYLENYRNKVKDVTRGQAAAAAQAILDQKNWVLVVCGPADLEKSLSEFGTVVKVANIFDPLSK